MGDYEGNEIEGEREDCRGGFYLVRRDVRTDHVV